MLTINIQMLILCCEYQITVSSGAICIGHFETFQPLPVLSGARHTAQGGLDARVPPESLWGTAQARPKPLPGTSQSFMGRGQVQVQV